MNDTVKRNILVVDDSPSAIEHLTNHFKNEKWSHFANWNITDPHLLAVLESMELTPVQNAEIQHNRLSQVLGRLHDPAENIAGIISDYGMPISREYAEMRFNDIRDIDPKTTNPSPEEYFSKNLRNIDSSEGGLQLAKVAKIAGIPLVIYTGGSKEAKEALHAKRLKHLNPAGYVPVYSKTDYPGIFKTLAREILEKEQAQSTSTAVQR